LYSVLNVALCLVILLRLGWASVVGVFLIYFFISIMFHTIFALGIFGLGRKAKKASSFIVMAIMGGAILPKLSWARPPTGSISLAVSSCRFCASA
jgi:MFS transporter, FHS family, L-fucose permease